MAGCDSGSDSGSGGDHEPTPDPDPFVRGYGLSPDGFPADFSRVDAFLDEVASLERSSVMFNGPWRDDVVGGSDAGEVPEGARLVAGEADRGYTPVTVFGWQSGEETLLAVPGNATTNWTNSQARAAFVSMVSAFAEEYQPPVIFLGNESDFYYEQDPEDYLNWILAYEQAREAIRQVSPKTLVGPVFNVEHLTGRGALVGWNASFTSALTLHDPATFDVIGLTVYPFLGHASVDDVPSDYLDPVVELIPASTPVMITETGWPANASGGQVAWETGLQQQVEFVDALGRMTGGHNVTLANWLFLYPLTSGVPDEVLFTFGSVSTRDENGSKRPVYDVWTAFPEQ